MAALPTKVVILLLSVTALSFLSNADDETEPGKDFFSPNTTQCLASQVQQLFNAGSNLGGALESCTSGIQTLGQNIINEINSYNQDFTGLMSIFQKLIGCGGVFCQWTDVLNATTQITKIASDLAQLTAEVWTSPTQWSPVVMQCFSDTISRVSGTLTNVTMCFTASQ